MMIEQGEYKARRARLMEAMGEGALAIIPAAGETIRNGDAHHPFRQDSNFYYLTGFNEPDAVAVLNPGSPDGKFILFNRPRDPKLETWHGPRAGQEGACEHYGADQAFPIELFEEKMLELFEGKHKLYYPVGLDRDVDDLIMEVIHELRVKTRSGIQAPESFCSIEPLIHEMRLHKSAAEIDLMKHVGDFSAKAHCRAMKACRPDMMEYELEAELLHDFYRQGSRSPAYTSIVAAGKNACILHYINNQDKINDGDLVLIDAGAEYEGYAADITRTFPANGRFTESQKAIYDIVLQAQLAGIEQVKPGNPWSSIQDAIVSVLTEGLISLGILNGKLEKLLKDEAYKKLYIHSSGHWLGLDVHDAGVYKMEGEWRALEPGMVLTVEPGLYIPAGSKGVDKKWWDIGVRIEDDVLVTDTGYDVLTYAVPKKTEEIESLMVGNTA